MTHPYMIVIYVALAALVGFFGRKRTAGFPGIFVLAILLTPIVMAIALLATGKRANT
jgi:hypothetical protein